MKKKIHCPICKSNNLEETLIEGNLRSDCPWSHEGFRCKDCGCEFAVWC